MKNTFKKTLIIAFMLATMLPACSDDESEVIPSSNTIALLNTANTAIEGETIEFSSIFVGSPTDLTSDVTVGYSISGDGIEDFTGSFTIPAEDARNTFEITMPEDNSLELDTTEVTLILTDASGGLEINENTPQNTHVFELIDDIKEISLSSSDTKISEVFSENGEMLMIPLDIPYSLDGEVSVEYGISGTAVAGDDYTLLSDNPLVLPAGTKDATINIMIVDDLDLEVDGKTLTIELEEIEPTDTDDEETFLTSVVDNQSITYAIEDDIKTFSFDRVPTDTLFITAAGSSNIQVLIDGALLSSVVLDLDFSLPSGVSITDVEFGDEIIFGKDQTSALFKLEVEESAFTGTDVKGFITLDDPDPNNGDEETITDSINSRINFEIINPEM